MRKTKYLTVEQIHNDPERFLNYIDHYHLDTSKCDTNAKYAKSKAMVNYDKINNASKLPTFLLFLTQDFVENYIGIYMFLCDNIHSDIGYHIFSHFVGIRMTEVDADKQGLGCENCKHNTHIVNYRNEYKDGIVDYCNLHMNCAVCGFNRSIDDCRYETVNSTKYITYGRINDENRQHYLLIPQTPENEWPECPFSPQENGELRCSDLEIIKGQRNVIEERYKTLKELAYVQAHMLMTMKDELTNMQNRINGLQNKLDKSNEIMSRMFATINGKDKLDVQFTADRKSGRVGDLLVEAVRSGRF